MGRRAWIKFYGERWLRDGGVIEHGIGERGTFATLLALVCDGKYGDEGYLRVRPGKGFSDNTIADLLNIDARTWASHKATLLQPKYDGEPLIEVSDANEIRVVGWTKMQPAYRRQAQTDTKTASNGDSLALPEVDGRSEKREGRGENPEERNERHIDPMTFQHYWNRHPCLKQIRTMTKDRRRKLAIRAESKDFRESWREAVDALPKIPFYRGENDRHWRAEADWFLRNDTNWLKALEQMDTTEVRARISKEKIAARERELEEQAEKERLEREAELTPQAKAMVKRLANEKDAGRYTD